MTSIGKLFIFLCLGITLTNCSEKNISKENTKQGFETQIIYGVDNRRDWYEAPTSELLKLAESTVALVYGSDLTDMNTHYKMRFSSSGWCSDEAFVDQSTTAFCSGFLVAPNLIVTAGHCVRSTNSCKNMKFIFGYALKSRSHDYSKISKDDVYSCSDLVVSEVQNIGADYAVVKLDRPVKNHKPLELRKSGVIKTNQSLAVIGHPSGLPSKIADGANVRSISSKYFTANLDTYGGNSGSAVFNTSDGKVEGILVRGGNDFVYSNGCARSNICKDDECRGEDVTKITEVLSYIPDFETEEEEEIPSSSVSYFLQSNFNSLNIPDNSENGLITELDVSEPVNGRNILIHLNISHTYIGDLVVGLISPSGKTVRLFNRDGGSKNDLVGVFGDTLISDEDLQILSKEAQGVWKLAVLDLARLDNGQLKNWAIEFK